MTFASDLLAGKRVLVTGGGTGLGRAMAGRVLALGATALICGRRGEVLNDAKASLERECGGTVETVQCDIRDAPAVDAMIETFWAKGGVDVLINNAAGNFIARTETLSSRAVDAVLNIVLHGTAYVTIACGKRWIAECRHANVLNIITTYAWTGSGYVVPSAMGKAGVLALTHSLAAEWGHYGIRTNAIAPGPIPTEGAWARLLPTEGLEAHARSRIPLGRFGEPSELADLVAFVISDRASFINGAVIAIDGGEWVMGAGEFNGLSALSESDWVRVRSAQPSRRAGG